MNILMCTNTFTPHVGGVARSVLQFSEEYRRRGHRVLVVAPEFPGTQMDETNVVRIPAVQHFNGSDFSVPVPVPGMLTRELGRFDPDIVHSHHPFLLGGTALRLSAVHDVPVVFTHHTQYEQYTHYVPGDSDALKRFVVDLAVGYCNLCDAVIAPSETIRQRLREQGVKSEIVEIPTGVDATVFGEGNGIALRDRMGISQTTFVVGHVGRLAPEKGLDFLATAVAELVACHPDARFLVAGTGPSEISIQAIFAARGLTDRLILMGTLDRVELADVYAAMDVFAFASLSETQGMVLTEAMAASTPVVAVDGPGVREVVRDQVNGRLLPEKNVVEFVRALRWFSELSAEQRRRLAAASRDTADELSMPRMAERALDLYGRLIHQDRPGVHGADMWSTAQRRIEEEWKIWSNVVGAASHAFLGK